LFLSSCCWMASNLSSVFFISSFSSTDNPTPLKWIFSPAISWWCLPPWCVYESKQKIKHRTKKTTKIHISVSGSDSFRFVQIRSDSFGCTNVLLPHIPHDAHALSHVRQIHRLRNVSWKIRTWNCLDCLRNLVSHNRILQRCETIHHSIRTRIHCLLDQI
jgi:hypothetical protein